MAAVVWIKQSNGLANKYDPSRIKYDPKEGVEDFAEAHNVDIDMTGAVSRRLGFVETDITSDVHSLWNTEQECFGVVDNKLCSIGMDWTTKVIVARLTPGKYMSYCQYGDSTIFMNGAQSGAVKNGTAWNYTKPTNTRYPDSTREYDNPPVGSIVRASSGRVYIADGNTLWYSEPFAPNLFRRATNFIYFPSRITMVAPVSAGLFVSTTKKIYFLKGLNPKEFFQTVIANYPAIEGTDVEADGIAVGGNVAGALPIQIFTTTEGICIGTSDGRLLNVTYDRLEYPKSLRGCGLYTGKKYIVSMGSASSTDLLTLCLSLGRLAVSQYANYHFNSMVKYDGNLLGGNSSGLFVLDSGDNDNGTSIEAWLRTGPTDFGAEEEKRLRKIYLSYRTDGRMKMYVAGDDKDFVAQDIVPTNDELGIIHQKVAGGRDLRGKHLDLKLANVNGSDFTINGVRAVLVVLGINTKEGA